MIFLKHVFDLVCDVIKQNKTLEKKKKRKERQKERKERKVKSAALPGQVMSDFTKSKAVLAVGFSPSLPTVR